MLPASTPANSSIIRQREWLLLATGLIAILAWLAMRNHGLYPAIFADEWYYSKMSRLMPLSESILPSYLYLWLFSASSACGTGFLDCVRYGNVALFVGAGPFIYLIGRQVAPAWVALTVTLACLLSAFNLYTAFFMPEAAYYFGFLVLSWLLLTRARWGWLRLALAAGVVLGLMSLVKVHALFLVPGLGLFLIGAGWLDNRTGRWLRDGVAGAVVLGVTMLAIKFGLGYVLAGDTALSLFGSFYSSTASSGTSRTLGFLAAAGFINGRGHVMALALLLPLPMAMLLQWVLSHAMRQAASPAFNRLTLFTLLMLGSAGGMTVAYTASISGLGPNEVLRLHLRYYSFTFPLLMMIGGAVIANRSLCAVAPRMRVLASLLVAAAIVTAMVLLPRYSIASIDGPELSAIPFGFWSSWAVAGLGLAVLGLWALGQWLAAPLFLFALLPATVVLGYQLTTTYLAQIVPGWAPDRAGIAARDHVPQAERKDITIAAASEVEIMRAQFHIDDANTSLLELAPGAALESYQLPVRKKWLLVIGPHALPADLVPVLKTDDYALVRLASDFRPLGLAKLSEPIGAGHLVTRIDGMSVAEPWGRWSQAKQVVLHFDRALPERLDVILKGRAYADNTKLPFTMRVGDQEGVFRLPASTQEVRLRFITDGRQRSLTIDVPKPTSPKSLGEWPDVRELGIGIVEVGIGNGAAPSQKQK